MICLPLLSVDFDFLLLFFFFFWPHHRVLTTGVQGSPFVFFWVDFHIELQVTKFPTSGMFSPFPNPNHYQQLMWKQVSKTFLVTIQIEALVMLSLCVQGTADDPLFTSNLSQRAGRLAARKESMQYRVLKEMIKEAMGIMCPSCTTMSSFTCYQYR